MKKVRWIFLTCFVLIVMSCPVYATQSRSDNFSKSYSLTGNGAADIVAIANAQYTKTGSDLGYTEDWCADFVSDCAKLAGQSSAIPADGGVSGLYNNILSAGGSRVSGVPQVGDIAIMDWGGAGNYYHVEIVASVSGTTITTIGGNSGRNTSSLYTSEVWKHTYVYTNSVYTCFVRPNYSSSSGNNYAPTGSFLVAVGQTGSVYVGGWAYDQDDMNKQIAVDVYIGAPLGSSGAEGHRISANSADWTQGSGANHGFSTSIETNIVGTHIPVYCYAVDLSMQSNTLLSGTCLYVDITEAKNVGFDLNWSLDGKQYNCDQTFATADVYINGALIANDCTDYANYIRQGSSYEIKDIKPKTGYKYVGASAALTGTISDGFEITLKFETIKSSSSTTVTKSTDISAPKTILRSVKNIKGKKLNIVWLKNLNVNGYVVQISANKAFSSGVIQKFVNSSLTGSLKVSKLKKKKIYYVRVCTYRVASGQKVYSDWSNVKKIKIKK